MTEIQTYSSVKKEPEQVDPVARSLARPDACAKPATIGHPKGVRIRPTNHRLPGRPKKRKRDYRDVRYF